MTIVEPLLNPEYSLAWMLTSPRPAPSEPTMDSIVLSSAEELTRAYADVLPRYEVLNAYYRGDPPLPTTPERMTAKYRNLLQLSRSNWCGLIVDVVDERLRIDAIRSSDEPVLDETLWGWWEANNMDLHSSEVHVEALKLGVCYLSVWPPSEPGGPPRYMGESPLSTYVRCDDVTHNPIEAIRIWRNSIDGRLYADYTTPEWQFKLVSADQVCDCVVAWNDYKLSSVDLTGVQWQFRADTDAVLANRIGRVPYVVFVPRPDLLGGYHSEIEGLLPIQDRINQTTFDRMVTQEMTAFPQRWVTGIDIPTDAAGNPREPFDAAVDRVWTLSAPDGGFGQFPQSSPEGYLAANTADIQALATQSRTPPHYLIAGMGQFPSGESVRATEYGLSRKVNARQLALTDPWGDVNRLAALVMGDDARANDPKIKVRWAQVEAHSEAEVADAILKLSTLPGVPIEPLVERAGLDPSTFSAYRSQLGATPGVVNTAVTPGVPQAVTDQVPTP
jgi:hypothetical protein